MSTSEDRLYLRGIALSAAGMIVISPDGLLLRLIEGAGLWQIVFYRTLLMGLALLAVLVLFYRRRLPAVARAMGPAGALSAVLLAGTNFGFVSAMLNTTVANVLVILATMPLFSAVLGWLLIGERVRPRTAAAIALALVGILIIFSGSLGGGTWLGDLFAVATALTHGLNLVVLRRAGDRDMTPALCASGFLAAPLALALAGGDAAVSTHDLQVLLLLGLVVIPLAVALFISGTRTVPAAEVALFALLETVLGPLWAWLGVGEVPSLESFVGGGLVLAAVALNSTLAVLARRRRRAA